MNLGWSGLKQCITAGRNDRKWEQGELGENEKLYVFILLLCVCVCACGWALAHACAHTPHTCMHVQMNVYGCVLACICAWCMCLHVCLYVCNICNIFMCMGEYVPPGAYLFVCLFIFEKCCPEGKGFFQIDARMCLPVQRVLCLWVNYPRRQWSAFLEEP